MQEQTLLEAMEKLLRALFAEFRAELSTEKGPKKKFAATRIERTMGLWIIPDDIEAGWVKQYPLIDVKLVLRDVGAYFDSGKRPPRSGYRRFIEQRLRMMNERVAVNEMRKPGAAPGVPCQNHAVCGAPALLAIAVDGLWKNFCRDCGDAERARQLMAAVQCKAPAVSAQPEREPGCDDETPSERVGLR